MRRVSNLSVCGNFPTVGPFVSLNCNSVGHSGTAVEREEHLGTGAVGTINQAINWLCLTGCKSMNEGLRSTL